MVFPAGAAVPHVEGLAAASGDAWARPLSGAGGAEHPLYATYALVLATFLGTMGLPHVLVRFYTNPDGAAARRTTLYVLALLGAFYLLPTVYAVLGRLYAPEVLLTGRTDAVVLALPTAALGPGLLGVVLEALLVAGAFAAFLSTSSGLLVSTAGVLVQDVLGGTVAGFRQGDRPGGRGAARPGPARRRPAGGADRRAGLRRRGVDLLPAAGARHLVARADGDRRGGRAGGRAGRCRPAPSWRPWSGAGDGGWTGALLAQPGAWTVPTAFAVMVGRLARHPGLGAGRRRPHDAPAARPGGARPGPRPLTARRRRPAARRTAAHPSPHTCIGRLAADLSRSYGDAGHTPGVPPCPPDRGRAVTDVQSERGRASYTATESKYLAAQESAEFQELRRRYRGWVHPGRRRRPSSGTSSTSCWPPTPRTSWPSRVLGNINVGLVMGLLQFVSTFGVTALYISYANRVLDPVSEKIRDEFEAGR